jgi:hypothetical protein
MTKFFTKQMFAMLIVAVMGVASAFAQPSGGITGVVTDSTGAIVPNATVKLVNKAKGVDKTATATEDGIYNFTVLEPGIYTVTVSSGSFAPKTLEVEVQVGRVTNAPFALGAGEVAASVEVTAEGVQTTQSNNDAVVNSTAIDNLPINGRRFQDFVTLTPTAQVDPSRGQISLAGQKGINGNVNVDGVDYNQPFFGGIRGGERSNLAFTIPQESIKEFQVVATGYSAEYGRSSGGIVNAITKTGTNEFSGSAFWLYRPAGLARGNEFTDALQTQRLDPLGLDATLAPTQHQFGGSVGGAIIKDKLYYFASYEQQRFRAPRQIVFSLPVPFPPAFTPPLVLTPAQQDVLNFYNAEQVQYTQTNDAWAGLGRLDWAVNNIHNFNIRYSMSRNNAINAASRGETSADPTTRQSLSTNGTEQDRTRILVAQLISSFNPNYLNEFRFQYAREERPRLSNSTVPQILNSFSTYGAGGADTSSFLPNREYDDRFQGADSFTIIHGSHTLKFGGEYSYIYAAQTFGFNQFGQYNASLGGTCASAASCAIRDILQVMSNVPSGTNSFLGRFDSTSSSVFYQKQIGNLATSFKVREAALFFQDNWRINPNWTVNYGLRTEIQYNPTPDASNEFIANLVRNTIFPIRNSGFEPGQIADSGWQWGPRLGFAWDPKADGKTVIRGYGGIYYARTPGIWLAPVTQTFRQPPADVSTRLPFALNAANITAFNSFLNTTAGTPYRTITGCNPAGTADQIARCNPNTLYRQFAIVGINLNSSPLSSLPILTNDNISAIAGAFGLTPSPFVGAQVIGQAEDYKNPRSVQWGAAFERQVGKGLVLGVDYANVSTHRIGRHRDINIPGPLTAQQYVDFLQAHNTPANYNTFVTNGNIAAILAAGRTIIATSAPAGMPVAFPSLNCPTGVSATPCATRPRPVTAQQGFQLGSVALHESTGKALFQGLTFRARWVADWVQLNTYYTLSRTLTDDDNERQEGVGYAEPYDLTHEYNYGRMDRKHNFMANPIFFLPWDFEVSSAVRFRSGLPFNPTVGADLNGDGINNDRPLNAPGDTFFRNSFRNNSIFDMDLRVQKTFKFNETMKFVFSTEFFNVLNRANILVGTATAPSSATAFGSGGQYCVTTSTLCGLSSGPAVNPNFLQVRDPATGTILLSNVVPGSPVFQMQFGARFYW